ncbi:hypothetical protein Dda_8658 [Drechslerella dactyloides]|uniref:Uncharacterized protein n=1 Tax=Drechslerella dactyloides TaxID=74499 RepID=A0AAD6IQR0_DREDA|nr:hypothetical protein Dda_8658 [Drechslerella dactyloides]
MNEDNGPKSGRPNSKISPASTMCPNDRQDNCTLNNRLSLQLILSFPHEYTGVQNKDTGSWENRKAAKSEKEGQ